MKALEAHDESAMKECVNRNFDCRREIWGVEALGGENGPNLRMINVGVSIRSEGQIARKHGMAAKFCGSGGAVVIVPGFSYKEDVIESLKQ